MDSLSPSRDPALRDAFTIIRKCGMRSSMISFSSVAGIGSAGEVLMVMFLTMSLISFSVAGRKTCSSEAFSELTVEIESCISNLFGSEYDRFSSVSNFIDIKVVEVIC